MLIIDKTAMAVLYGHLYYFITQNGRCSVDSWHANELGRSLVSLLVVKRPTRSVRIAKWTVAFIVP